MPNSLPPFIPAAEVKGPHAQTIFAAIARPRHAPSLRRERWDTDDGDFVDVDRMDAPPAVPHVVVLHGLEGSSRAGYVLAILREAQGAGFGAVALNFRSCSGEPNRLVRSYSSGDTGDVALVCKKLRAEGVTGPLFGVGFSLGGNVLLRFLGETADACPLTAAVAISVPFNLKTCTDAIDSGRGLITLYRQIFLSSLKAKAEEKAARFPGEFDMARARRARGIREFDDAVTAPIYGFASADEYYDRCSSGSVLWDIRRKTLLISSMDDPLVPGPTLPRFIPHAFVETLLTSRGGHVGFVGGTVLKPEFWAEVTALRFCARSCH